jgi:carbonic anhydrase
MHSEAGRHLRKVQFQALRRYGLKKVCLSLVLCGAATALIVGVALLRGQETGHEQYVSPWRTPWTYEQEPQWGELDPEYAACNGKEQSPIDIRNTQKADLPPLVFEFKNGPLRFVTNNRYTIRVNYRPGNGNFLNVGDKRYELVQFHFHHPSEEYINGKAPYPMIVHLMYKASDGGIAGVTVFVKSGAGNSTVQKVWDHMPDKEGGEEVTGVKLNPGGLVPSEMVNSYYMYMGSLSAPPCTEGVTWFILKHPVELSSKQIEAFARLFPNDARPLKPLNGRVVKESE